MKTYLQYIKENTSLDPESYRDTPFKKEIHIIYQVMPDDMKEKRYWVTNQIIRFLKKYIDKEFEIEIDDRTQNPYKLYKKEIPGWIISFNIKEEYITGSLAMPFAVDYYFDENYKLIYLTSCSDDYPSIIGNKIIEAEFDKHTQFLNILRNYFEEHPECIGDFPIEKLFPDYDKGIIKLKEWS